MMEGIIALFEANLGAGLENIVLFVTALGSLIFMARDFRLGLIILWILFASEYIVFYQLGMETFFALTAFLSTFAVLSLSLYIIPKKTGGYGIT